MKTWVFIALFIQALLIVSIALVMYFVPIQVELLSTDSTAPPPIKVRTQEDINRDFKPMTKEELTNFDIRWSNAPTNIRRLAQQIVLGEKLSVTELSSIGAEALSKGYFAPEFDREWDGTFVPWQSTLLKEAVWAYNFPATKALLAAGADPNVDHGAVLFTAIRQRTRGAPNFALFPDFDEMIPFLRAYLEAGANPNVQEFGFRAKTPIQQAELSSNLAAMLLILEFGGDPWLKLTMPNGYPGRSVMESLSFGTASPIATEILFRLAKSNFLPRGPKNQEKIVLQEISASAKEFASSNGPSARHLAWCIDVMLQVLGPALGHEVEANEIRANLTNFGYQADGGWYLAENEIHSPIDEPLSLPDKGSEIWGP